MRPSAVAALVVMLGMICFASASAAQQAVVAPPRLNAPWRSFAVPRLVVGELPAPAHPALQRRRRSRAPGTAFMIVGGAVAAAGILADESLLVIGGVAVAGWGLYLYLR